MSFISGLVLSIILIFGGFGYWQYHQNIVMHEELRASQLQEQQKDIAVQQLTTDLQTTVKRIGFVEKQNVLIQSNTHASMQVLEKHDSKTLNEIATKKAVLVERRVNVATQRVLDNLELLTDPNWKP